LYDTGKTTTIVEIIAMLVNRGKRVLVSAFQNSALDTLLLKLASRDIDFLRLGRSEAVSYLSFIILSDCIPCLLIRLI
jgi:hypothetical protein